jgi:hypothetical protein
LEKAGGGTTPTFTPVSAGGSNVSGTLIGVLLGLVLVETPENKLRIRFDIFL